tara:strand:- start:241 stop:615 length:375 start_codon:yes stop_codon:yes gene_type:complete
MMMSKYLLYISTVLNGVLLMFLLGIIPFLLYLSILTNIGFLWYIKKIIEKNSALEEDIVDIVSKLDAFSDHLEEIHALEMYYGDDNLQNLIEHSRMLINNFIDFQQIYFDVEVTEEVEHEKKEA